MNTINGTSHPSYQPLGSLSSLGCGDEVTNPRRDYTYLVRVSLPNDHGSEDDHALLIDAFLQERGGSNDFDPSDLSEWAFDELHLLWPGLVWIHNTDFGALFRTTTAQPADLPRYYWVEQVDAL